METILKLHPTKQAYAMASSAVVLHNRVLFSTTWRTVSYAVNNGNVTIKVDEKYPATQEEYLLAMAAMLALDIVVAQVNPRGMLQLHYLPDNQFRSSWSDHDRLGERAKHYRTTQVEAPGTIAENVALGILTGMAITAISLIALVFSPDHK